MKGFLGLLIFLVGLLAGFMGAKWAPLTLSATVDVGNLLNVIVTLLVAILLNWLFVEHSSKRKLDLDFLGRFFEDCRDALRRVESSSSHCTSDIPLNMDERAVVLKDGKALSNAVGCLEEALLACEVDPTAVGFHRLTDSRIALKEAVTDSPFPGPYPTDHIARINECLNRFRSELMRLWVIVNRR
jgi:hypothetical protein